MWTTPVFSIHIVLNSFHTASVIAVACYSVLTCVCQYLGSGLEMVHGAGTEGGRVKQPSAI